MHNIEEKQGYKFTEEFDYIPEDWDVAKIKDKSEVKTGGTPSTSISEYWNGNIKWMSSGELNNKRIYDVVGRITEIGLNNSSANMIPKNSILIGLAGQGKTRGTAAINYVDLSTNQSIAAILPSKYFNSEFLYQCIDKRYEELRELSSGGGGRGGLNKTLIMNLPILLPPLPEQEKIAEVLSDIDELIESTQKLIDKKKDLKTATMQKLLTPKPPWLKKTLGELNIKMLKGSGLSKEDLKDNGRYSCIHYGELFTYYKEHINKILHFTDEMTVPSKENDVLMPSSDVTPTGLAKASCINFKDVALGGDILIIRCENIIDGTFLSYIIRKDKKQILQLVSGTTVYHIYPNDMKRFEIFYPNSISEQKNIVSILQDMDAEIEALEKELNKYKDLKTGMMQELLTGKKRLV